MVNNHFEVIDQGKMAQRCQKDDIKHPFSPNHHTMYPVTWRSTQWSFISVSQPYCSLMTQLTNLLPSSEMQRPRNSKSQAISVHSVGSMSLSRATGRKTTKLRWRSLSVCHLFTDNGLTLSTRYHGYLLETTAFHIRHLRGSLITT